MTTPVEAWIRALQLRMKLVAPHRRTPPGEFPPGWQQWFAAMPERTDAVTGADVDALVEVFVQREPARPPASAPELSRWQAFNTLWRQEWDPPTPDDRPVRWIAWTISVGWHLLLAGLLVWLMYLQLTSPSHPPRKGEEEVVQIEFVGEGTLPEVGGGPAAEPARETETRTLPESGQASAAPAPSQPAPSETAQMPDERAAEVTPVETPPPAPMETAPSEVAEPAPPAVQQAVQVSEPVPEVSQEFVLPPPTPVLQRDVVPLAMPELTMPVPQVEVAEVPNLQRPSVAVIPSQSIRPPVLEQAVPKLVEREIAAPLPRLPTPSIAQPVIASVERQPTAPALRSRDIPSPPSDSSPSEQAKSSPATASASDVSTPAPAAAGADTKPGAIADTAGPKPVAAPGGWATPARGDDWGDSTRERPGAQRGQPPGLYDSDGSVRLAEPPGSASPGRPPGTPTDEIVNLDRAGTWLKRPPTDYEPTAFDRYWRPNESLLEEWVRKSVTTIRVPIPGTNKYVVCTTVMLVLGGACDITDSNLNNQPATARPSPDVPFKPELQEGNGSAPASGG